MLVDVYGSVSHHCASKCILRKSEDYLLLCVHELYVLISFLPCVERVGSHLRCESDRAIHPVFHLWVLDEKRGDGRMMGDVFREDLRPILKAHLQCLTKNRVEGL